MLRIETDGTVTADGFRIGEVSLDDEKHRFKIGGILRDAPEDKLEGMELELGDVKRDLRTSEQDAGCHGDCEATATLAKVRELVA